MRPAALGRKNYLFLGSVEGGGKRASVFYTLTQSAKRLGLEPFEYLSSIIERIASHPQSRIEELTPLGFKESRARAEELRGAECAIATPLCDDNYSSPLATIRFPHPA